MNFRAYEMQNPAVFSGTQKTQELFVGELSLKTWKDKLKQEFSSAKELCLFEQNAMSRWVSKMWKTNENQGWKF